ncbi:MAG: aminopeptidase [Atopobiaceae bacterium]|nr:aminopeptidase [Atopobiaceae bacterium]
MKRTSAWFAYDNDKLTELDELAEDYKAFISQNKTERECTVSAVDLAEQSGFKNLAVLCDEGAKLKSGDKLYAINRGKGIMLMTLGELPLEDGFNILGAHIDSPRLDIKQNPLSEDKELAYLDTHYYGGIKKYQWLTLPLAIHGVVALKDGSKKELSIGEQEEDPVFVITDLLPHLAADQMGKKASEFVEGEMLDLLVGNRPLTIDAETSADDAVNGAAATTNSADATTNGAAATANSADASTYEAVKAQIIDILSLSLGISEEDFLSAELEVVPAGPARDLGFDRSMILGYGHDDRACAYTSLMAHLAVETPRRTAVTILVDKEEIGSVGATGMTSRFFEDVIAEVFELVDDTLAIHKTAGYSAELALRRCLRKCDMLSSDVSAAFDPAFASAFEVKNSAFLGQGIAFNKYTGSRGKGGSNDADAEYVAAIRRIMDDADVSYQTCELGKVDQGGGGTIAYILAKYGMDVIDCGVPVLSMHAPWEVISKADLFEAYRCYMAFLASTQ